MGAKHQRNLRRGRMDRDEIDDNEWDFSGGGGANTYAKCRVCRRYTVVFPEGRCTECWRGSFENLGDFQFMQQCLER